MAALMRHVFLLVALLVISATSYALSSENVVPNRDHDNSTHGQGRGSVRANEKVVDTLEEERAGDKVFKLFGAALSQPKDTDPMTNGLKQLAEKDKEETQRVADLRKDKQPGHDLLDDGTPASGEKVVKLFGADISSPKDQESVTKALKQLAEKNEETQRVADLPKDTELDHNLLDDGTAVSKVVEKVPSHPEAADGLGRTIVGVKRKAPALEEENQKLKQHVVDLQGKQGTGRVAVAQSATDEAGTSNPLKTIEDFIDDWGLDRKVVDRRTHFFQELVGKPHASNPRLRYMAVGSVYFEHPIPELEFKEKMTPIMEDAVEFIDVVLNRFSDKNYNLDRSKAVKEAVYVLSKEDSVPYYVARIWLSARDCATFTYQKKAQAQKLVFLPQPRSKTEDFSTVRVGIARPVCSLIE